MTSNYATTAELIDAIEKAGIATITKRSHVEALFVLQSEMTETEAQENEKITNLLIRQESDARRRILDSLRRIGQIHGELKPGNGVGWAKGVTSDVTLEINGARVILDEVRSYPEMFKSLASYDLRNSTEFVQGLRFLFEIDTPTPDANVRSRHTRTARVTSAA